MCDNLKEKRALMKRTTQVKRSIRAISPVIATLLMIAIAVVASLVAYAWVMGYMGGTTAKAGNAIQIQSIALDPTDHLVVYVQNVGQGDVVLDSGYVNSASAAQSLSMPLTQGETGVVTTTYTVTSDTPVLIKIVTTDGTFAQYTGSPDLGSVTNNQVTFILGDGGSSMTPTAGEKAYTSGTTVFVNAIAASGYQFSSWTSTTDSITFDSASSALTNAHINGEGTIEANFVAVQQTQNYQVTFNLGAGGSSMSPTAGTQQTYSGGASVPISAVAASGYQFSSWTSSGTISFDSAASILTTAHVNGAGSITANFVATQPTQNYQVNWNLGAGGYTMSPTGTYSYAGGSLIAVFAAPNSGYQFSYWGSSTTFITFDSVTSASTTAHINGAGSVTANFIPVQTGQNYQVTFSTNGGGSSSTTSPSGTKTYAAGTVVPILATADSGYLFSSWSSTGAISIDSSTSASTNARINGEGSIIANFIVPQPTQNYPVTFNLGTGGASMSPSGTQTYAGGSAVTISAAAASGYQFHSWTSTGAISFDSATSSSTIVHINSAGSVTANFVATETGQNYQVTFNLGAGGLSINPTGTQTYAAGSTVAISTIPASGYKFAGWTSAGTISFDSAALASTNAHISSDGTITANFALDQVHITATAGANGVISPSGLVAVNRGADQTFTITPNSGYVVASLMVDGVSAGYGQSYTFTAVTADHTIAVTFAQGSTVLSTGFDGNPWDNNWMAGGNPPWRQAPGEGVGGTVAAKSDSLTGDSGPFTSNSMNTQGATTIRITFMYKVLNTNAATDLKIEYAARNTASMPDLTAGSRDFTLISSIGLSAPSNVWTPGSVTLTSSAAAPYFYFRFESTLQTHNPGGIAETVWIDNIIITRSP